ncbi:MAG: glycoside hydrolase family 28 protein, partial [Candidatus Hydrogenedentes bacterium]|nr:glycoside hydrolase family 28 protein [Candidatus Hydrogenedentota bacterium]
MRLLTLVAYLLAAGPAFETAAVSFNVRDHGAIGDKITKDTASIQATINAAYASGGGTVLFPPGAYLS